MTFNQERYRELLRKSKSELVTIAEARILLGDEPHWCAYKNCDGPFTPTEDLRQKYCSSRCKLAAKNSRGQRAKKRAEKKAAYEASKLNGISVTEVIVDEMIHIWGVDYDNPETQKIVTEPKSFHDFGPSVDVKSTFDWVNLRERITRPMQLKAEVHERIRKMAEDDLKMILEFAEKLTTINFEWYQLPILYNYFYEHHRKEALGE